MFTCLYSHKFVLTPLHKGKLCEAHFFHLVWCWVSKLPQMNGLKARWLTCALKHHAYCYLLCEDQRRTWYPIVTKLIFILLWQDGDGGHSEANLQGEWHHTGPVPRHEYQLHACHPHGGRVLLHLWIDQAAAGPWHWTQYKGRITPADHNRACGRDVSANL